jgi:precorrin-6x reductase
MTKATTPLVVEAFDNTQIMNIVNEIMLKLSDDIIRANLPTGIGKLHQYRDEVIERGVIQLAHTIEGLCKQLQRTSLQKNELTNGNELIVLDVETIDQLNTMKLEIKHIQIRIIDHAKDIQVLFQHLVEREKILTMYNPSVESFAY